MNIILEVDTREFTKAIHALSNLSGVSPRRVVEFEAEKVLTAASKDTDAATAAGIRQNHNIAKFSERDLGLGAGRKLYNLDFHYPNRVFAALCVARNASLKRKLRARGLAKAAWLRLAEEAGLKIRVPSYVDKAVATTGRTYPENVQADHIGSGGKFAIRFITRQPTLRWAHGRQALQRALNGRVKYFETNLRKGVFNDMRNVAKRYSGLVVR